MKPSARLYNCTRCHTQVLICRHCDRGNVYCGDACARSARADTQRRARKKYQFSRPGRMANAQRQQRYRARQRLKVTQQGSALHPPNAVLPLRQNSLPKRRPQTGVIDKSVLHCGFCQRECDVFLRLDFLRVAQRHRSRRSPEFH